ncbi:MAG: hypothetical protein D6689_22140, partial [Deltaproteobacteria bacterium]
RAEPPGVPAAGAGAARPAATAPIDARSLRGAQPPGAAASNPGPAAAAPPSPPAGDPRAALLAAAAARAAALEAWTLVIEWLVLGVERDVASGATTAIARADVLPGLLHRADRAAREAAAAARAATGAIPLAARRAYQTARALRDGGPADQLAALRALWRATDRCRAAVALARAARAR